MSTVNAVRDDAARGATLPSFAHGPVLAVAGSVAALLTLVSGRYGYFGDELYFLAAGRHLDWSYADQPPLLPLLARVATTLFGDSVVALRIPATLVTAAGVVVAAALARELGGRVRAQVLTAVAYTAAPQILGTGHILATSTIDVLVWTTVLWLVTRWVRVRRDTLLFAAMLFTAIGLQNKYLVATLWLGIGIGAAAVGPRALLGRPLLWCAAAVAVSLSIPGLLWQARHGWPQLEMGAVIAAENAAIGGRTGFLPLALFSAGVITGVVLLCYGLGRLLVAPELRPYRFLGWSTVVITIVLLLAGGRFYYVTGLYPICWAAGAVQLERGRAGGWWRWAVSVPAAAVSALLVIPLVLPVLPAARANSTNLTSSASIGWPELVSATATVYQQLPAPSRGRAAVLTDNYWTAAAFARFGAEHGLPEVYSGRRGFWYFGAPSDTVDGVLFVGADVADLRPYFTEVRQVSTVAGTAGGLAGLTRDVPVWWCSGRTAPWPRIWPELRRLD